MVEQNLEAIDLGILLGLAYQRFVDDLRAALAVAGFDDLGGAYGFVFRALADVELSQRELARLLAITDQGTAKLVDEMEARGYLERRADPDDARVKRLRLATRGRAALTAARRFHAAFERRLARDLGAAPLCTARRALEAMARRGPDDDLTRARLRAT